MFVYRARPSPLSLLAQGASRRARATLRLRGLSAQPVVMKAALIAQVCLALHVCACRAATHHHAVNRGARYRALSSVLQLAEVNRKNYERALLECAQQVRWCERRTGRPVSLQSTCLRASGVAHQPGNRLSLLFEPQKDTVAWTTNCSLSESPLTVMAIEDAGSLAPFEPCGCVVLFPLEPPAVFPGYESAIARWYSNATLILSLQASGTVDDPRAKIFPTTCSSTWIPRDRWDALHDDNHTESATNARHAPKLRRVSMIASPKDFAAGHKLRHVLVQRFAAHYGIDVFGKGYMPLARLNKVDGLAPYAFSVVIENSREEYYMSEKLIDAFLTRTVPIYWGAHAATRLFDPCGIITFSGEDDFEDALRRATPEFYRDNADAIERNHWQARFWRRSMLRRTLTTLALTLRAQSTTFCRRSRFGTTLLASLPWSTTTRNPKSL